MYPPTGNSCGNSPPRNGRRAERRDVTVPSRSPTWAGADTHSKHRGNTVVILPTVRGGSSTRRPRPGGRSHLRHDPTRRRIGPAALRPVLAPAALALILALAGGTAANAAGSPSPSPTAAQSIQVW